MLVAAIGLIVKNSKPKTKTDALEAIKEHFWDPETIDVISWWRDDWQSATVVNSSLVEDPQSISPVSTFTSGHWSVVSGHC